MAFLGAASGLAILLWIVDGLLWVTLFIGTLDIGIHLRGGVWLLILFIAPILPVPATTLWKSAKKHKASLTNQRGHDSRR
jgi:hypothetical protein